MFAAMNRSNGVSLTTTISDSYAGALRAAIRLGLDMRVWRIVEC